jgi:hypothetical protein
VDLAGYASIADQRDDWARLGGDAFGATGINDITRDGTYFGMNRVISRCKEFGVDPLIAVAVDRLAQAMHRCRARHR